MTVTHVGSTRQYSANWEAIFGGKKRRVATSPGAPQASTAKQRSSTKKTAKKKTRGPAKA